MRQFIKTLFRFVLSLPSVVAIFLGEYRYQRGAQQIPQAFLHAAKNALRWKWADARNSSFPGC